MKNANTQGQPEKAELTKEAEEDWLRSKRKVSNGLISRVFKEGRMDFLKKELLVVQNFADNSPNMRTENAHVF